MELNEAFVVGPVGPYFDDVDAEYWNALSEGKFKLQRCSDCQTWIWAAAWRCGGCGSWDLDWQALEPKGRVFSWIRTHQSFAPEMANNIPFVTLLVEIPEADNKRLMGILIGDDSKVKIGDEVEGIIQPASELTDGQAILRWKLTATGEQK